MVLTSVIAAIAQVSRTIVRVVVSVLRRFSSAISWPIDQPMLFGFPRRLSIASLSSASLMAWRCGCEMSGPGPGLLSGMVARLRASSANRRGSRRQS